MSRLLVVATLLFSPAAADDSDRVAALTKALNHGSDKARIEAARELGRIGGQQAIAVLTKALDVENESLRHAVALALAKGGSKEPEVVAVLRTSLRAKAWSRRWGALHALTLVGRKARPAVPDLIHVFEAKDAVLSREAALALARIAPDSDAVVDALRKSLDRKDADHGPALFALKASGKKASAVLPSLVRLIKGSERPDIHLREFDLLVALAPPKLYSDLLETESPRTRANVLAALGRVGPRAREAIPAVCEWLANPSKRERENARDALRAIGAESLCDLIVWDNDEMRLVLRPVTFLLERKARQLIRILESETIGEQTRHAIANFRLAKRDQGCLLRMVSDSTMPQAIHCALLLLPHVVEDLESAEKVARNRTKHTSKAVRRAARDALDRIKRRKTKYR